MVNEMVDRTPQPEAQTAMSYAFRGGVAAAYGPTGGGAKGIGILLAEALS